MSWPYVLLTIPFAVVTNLAGVLVLMIVVLTGYDELKRAWKEWKE